MYDSVDVNAIPADATAVAGYVDGRWPTFRQLRRFHAHRLSIAVTASADAACLDVETGDATPGQAPEWVRRQHARGEPRPVIYASRDLIPQVLAELAAAHIPRTAIRVWSAHYGAGPHICSGIACGAPFTADATQHTDHALGRNLDESLLSDHFFPTAPPRRRRRVPRPRKPPAPHPKVTAATAAAAIGAAITAVLHSAGVHITAEEANAISALAALLAGYLTPAKRGAR